MEMIRPFFEVMGSGEFQGVTSIVTLLEVLVHPLRRKDGALAEQYRDILLNSEGLKTVPLSNEIAEEAALLRAEHNLRTPDAIQMATAIHEGASVFVTNDSRLSYLKTPQVLVLDKILHGPGS